MGACECSCFSKFFGSDDGKGEREYDSLGDLNRRLSQRGPEAKTIPDPTSVFDVCMITPHRIEMENFDLWLEGFTMEEAAKRIFKYEYQSPESHDLRFEDILNHVEDQWRTYQDLEHYLQRPELLKSQMLFQIELGQQSQLIEKYWDLRAYPNHSREFDDSRQGTGISYTEVARPLLGMQLTHKKKAKSLAALSKDKKVSLASCERMWANFRRVLHAARADQSRCVRCDEEPRCVEAMLKDHFRFPEQIARDYAQVAFACHIGFTLPKKMDTLNFDDMTKILAVMTGGWTSPPGLDLDESFVKQLGAARKTIKDKGFEQVMERFSFFNEFDQFALNAIEATMMKEGKSEREIDKEGRLKNFVEKAYRPALRGVLALSKILSSGNQRAELQDFFVEMVDKVIDPFEKCEATLEDVRLLFEYLPAVHELSHPERERSDAWDKFVRGIYDIIKLIGLTYSTVSKGYFYNSAQ